MKLSVIIHILLLFMMSANAQIKQKDVSYVFEHLSTEDGLSQSTVVDIQQDKDGFMWFATYNGVNRFDGYNFKPYQSEHDSASMKSNFIWSMFIDSQGTVWAGSNKGLGMYSKTEDRFIDIIYLTGYANEVFQVEDILEDKNGMIWFSTSSGLFKYNRTKNSLEQITPHVEAGFPYLHITQLEINKNGDIYLTAEDGLYLLSTKTLSCKLLTKLSSKSYKHSVIKEYIQRMAIDSSGNLWMASSVGNLFKYSPDKKKLNELNQITPPVFGDIFVANDSIIYLAVDIDGLIRLNTKTLGYEKLYDEENPNKEIGNGKNISVYVDNQNNLWTGHFQAGISFTQLEMAGFGLINYHNSQDTQISITSVSAILKDSKGYLWIGIDGEGIIRYYPNSTQYEIFRHLPDDPNSLPDNAVLSLFEDSKGFIWIGTYRGGLTKYNRHTDQFVTYQHSADDPSSIGSNDIRAIIEDDEGKLWCTCHGTGIAYFDPETGKSINYVPHEDGSNSIVNSWTFGLSFDKHNDLWITSAKGVSRFNTQSKRFYNYLSNPKDPKSINNDLVYCVFSDSEGKLWFGTDQGLSEYIFEDDRFELQLPNFHFSNLSILSIEEDNKGNLWISNNKGLNVYNPLTQKQKHYTISDGLQSNEYIRSSSYKDENGILYFGGVNGFNYFAPEQIRTNTVPPKVEITRIDLMGKPIPTAKLNSQNEYPHNQNFFTFYYVALNFKSPDKNRYKFVLEGLDKKWHSTTDQRQAIYTSLPPGSYTFRVIACNNDGIWNNEGAAYHFKIRPPWYSSWWFRITSVLAVSAFAFLIFYRRVKYIQKQNHQLELKVKERTNELKKANDKLILHKMEIESINQALIEKNQLITSHNQSLQNKNEEIAFQRDKLRELNKTKDKFFSIIAHDLKNPLNAMMGFAEILNISFDAFPEDKKKKFISIISKSSKNLYSLIENLLQWARSQSGMMQFNPKVTNITPIVNDCLNILSQQASKKSIRMFYIPTEGYEFWGDENMISTVIRNLASNAIKYTPQEGSIVFETHEDDKSVYFSIKDSGIGMTQEQVDSLFRISTNKSTQGTDAESGTGLGLILCKEFIDIHRGRIWAESEESIGSTFYIELPKMPQLK